MPALPFGDYVEEGQADEALETQNETPAMALVRQLKELKPLAFDRVRIGSKETRIYGSVTAEDVSNELKRQLHGASVDSKDISFSKVAFPSLQDGKIKSLGAFKVTITLSGAEPLDVDIEIKDV